MQHGRGSQQFAAFRGSAWCPRRARVAQVNIEPKGVLRKNLKPLLYLGAAALVIVAAIFSSLGKKAQAHQTAAGHEPPQPTVQDNTDNNVQNLKNTFAEARQRAAQRPGATAGQDPAMANATRAQQAVAAGYSATGEPVPCGPGENCQAQQSGYGQTQGGQQLSPAQEEAQQLAAKEREFAYNSRFASNLVYARCLSQLRSKPLRRRRRAQWMLATRRIRTSQSRWAAAWSKAALRTTLRPRPRRNNRTIGGPR